MKFNKLEKSLVALTLVLAGAVGTGIYQSRTNPSERKVHVTYRDYVDRGHDAPTQNISLTPKEYSEFLKNHKHANIDKVEYY